LLSTLILASTGLCGLAGIVQGGDAGGSLHERIDALLLEVGVGTPSPLCSDAEFVRRLSIDLLGSLPTAEEARRFLADHSPHKRSYLVGRLLDHPRYAVHMAHIFQVMLLERRNTEGIKQEDWERYLFESFLADKPYDQLAREILTADGTDPKTRPAVKFYLERNGDPNLLTRDVGRIFFARDLQCCQCHDHPLIEHYHQADYYGLFAFLQRGYLTLDQTKPENKDKPVYFAERAEGAAPATFQSVFDPKKAKHGTRPRLPGDTEIDEPYFPVGTEYETATTGTAYPQPRYSRRTRFASEILNSGNLAFRRNIVNRLWAQMMGQGLFEPVDLDHPDNPPANPALLNLLADEFRSMGYDIKVFLREVALTSAYQRSFELPPDPGSGQESPIALRLRFESEQQNLSSAVKELATQIQSTEGSLAPLRKAAEAVGEELTNAEAKAQEAKKAFDAASEALAKTKADADARQFAAEALADAASKTRTAIKRLSGEKALADAATAFQARSSSLAAEVVKLRTTEKSQCATATSAEQKLKAEQQKLTQIAVRLSAAQAKFAPIARSLADATASRQSLLTRLNSLKQAAAAAKSVEGYVARKAAASEAVRAAEAARTRQTLSRQLVSVRASLVSARANESALTRQFLDESELGESQLTAQLNADLDAAKKTLLLADKELAAAESRARGLASAADSELAIVSKHLSNRFSAASLKPLSPEQLGWNTLQVLGVAARERTAVEAELRKKNVHPTPAQLEWETDQKLRGPITTFVSLFGSAAGQPQRSFFATVDQALFFSNGGELRSWLAPLPGNLCDRLLKLQDPHALANELYLSVVTREPLPDEAAEIERYFAKRPKDRSAAVQEIVWALLASSEFRFNH
jgi:hypothetical protein